MQWNEKIKDFIDRTFENHTRAAELFEIKREQLYPYFRGDTEPGFKFLAKLRKFGCDMNYIFDDGSSDMIKEPAESYSVYNTLLRENKELKTEVEELTRQNIKLKEGLKNILEGLGK